MDQKGGKNIREEEQITAARVKHEDEEENAGIRPKETEKRKEADRSSE